MGTAKKVLDRVASHREGMIKLQRVLTATPAVGPDNGGTGEWDKAQVLLSWLAQLGIHEHDAARPQAPDREMIAAPDPRVHAGKRPNVVVTLPGKSQKRLWIMTHLDVVPPGDETLWEAPPWKLVEKEDRLIGRGVEDNQQSLVASVFALQALVEEQVVPSRTIKLLFVSDEETGSEYGLRYLLDNYDLFHEDDLILVPDGGCGDGSLIEVAEKSLLWLKFHTRGRQGHASLPSTGVNAFVAASHLVVRLDELNREIRQQNHLFDPPFSTFSLTKKEANVPNVNTIPGDDVFYMDCRVLPDVDLGWLMSRIREVCGTVERQFHVSVEVTTVVSDPSPATRSDTPLIPHLQRAIHRVYGVHGKPMGIGGGTVAAFLRRAGLDTVVWSRIDGTAHAPNEHCRVSSMVGDSQVMALLMLEG